MGRKQRNRNRSRNSQNTPKRTITPTSKKVISDIQKQEIETKKDELSSIKSVNELSTESKEKLSNAQKEDDLLQYWEYVKDISKRLEALKKDAQQEKERAKELRIGIEKDKQDLNLRQSELEKKLKDYNQKDAALTEREFVLDKEQYTTVIRSLLDKIKETEKQVFTDTEKLLKELTTFHKSNLDDFSEHITQNAQFQRQKAAFNREKKNFDIDKQIFEEDLREEFEQKYKEQLSTKTKMLKRLESKYKHLQENNEQLTQFFEDLENSFETTKPDEILKKYNLLTDELNQLKEKLNERPEQYELDSKQEQVEELKSTIQELQSKINEKELLELRQIFNSADSYIIEVNAYTSQIETAKIREATLLKTIDDLKLTLDQLKGDASKKSEAFEYAKKCDTDVRIFGYNYLEKQRGWVPKSLNDLSRYVQQWMAFHSDKPFYYSIETIRIFLAGLHMSPISILQGISGTGKTSLPREFAKALVSDSNYVGLDDDNQNKAPYRICAIQSGWRDSMDLMGYYNSFEHKYKETDFFKALYVANQPKYSDTLFLIILDEMNLSRPEHYFADFLSLLEQSPNERFIGLTSTPNEVLPALIKGGKLQIPKNVRFIGTANHDETTLEFAPKTYDRSNLMEMPKNRPNKDNFVKDSRNFDVKYSWLEERFEEAEDNHKSIVNKFDNFINSDDMKLLLMEKGIGVGNRLEFQAKKFISVFVESGNEKVKDLAIASDHLITSRLFRTLKNRYDFDKANMTSFKNQYVKLFKEHFGENPMFAIDLLNSEIAKK